MMTAAQRCNDLGGGGRVRRLSCRLAVTLLLLFSAGYAVAATYTSASTSFNWVDSSTHSKVGYNTVPYKLNAASGCGTTPPVTDDTLSDLIPIGFTFRYGATNYTNLYIQTNGRLQFGNTTCGAGTASIGPPQTYPYGYPNASMNNTMKVFGVDLDPTNLVDRANYPTAASKTSCNGLDNCYISFATIGTAPNRQFVVTWKNVPEWVTASNTSGSFDLQVILNENGSFVYQYGNIVHGGTGTAQIGWQLSTTDYAVLSFGAALEPPPNTAIIFYIPSPVATYRFDEGAWASAAAGQVGDSSGNGRSGTALGSAQSTAGGYICRGANIPANTAAATVDAIRTGVNIANAALNLLGTGTIAFWYKSAAAWSGAGAQTVQLVDATAVNGEWFFLTKTATGTLYFEVKDSLGTIRSVETPAQAFAANTWVYVTVAWNFNGLAGANQDRLSIFVNAAAPTVSSFTSSGTVTPQAGDLHLGDNPLGVADTKGSVNSANGIIDEAQVFNYEMSAGQVNVAMGSTHACPSYVIDHLEIQHGTGSGVTCSPSTLSIRACQNAACTTPFTGGVSGTLTKTGTPTVNWDGSTGGALGAGFAIGSGTSSTTKTVQVTTLGSVVIGMSALTPTVNNATSCNFGSPACTFTAADAGFILDVPDHVAELTQTVNVSAVKKADSSLACVPAFAGVSKSVTFTCTYLNPATGALPLRVGGNALNAANSAAAACDAGGRAVSLSFNASGVASTTFQYADVGKMQVNARYAPASGSEAGLVMTGTDSFVAAPASFAFSAVTASPIKAGSNFSATVTALNSAGNATANFGKESSPEGVTISFTQHQPTGTGAFAGNFPSVAVSGFAGGAATANTLKWSEVGNGDLTAKLTSGDYLASDQNPASVTLAPTGATGNSGALRFQPHHFETVVTPGCGSFTYAGLGAVIGQPFSVRVTARNGIDAGGGVYGTTVNYDGTANTTPNFARAVGLADANALGVGTLVNTSIAASAFTAGVATATTTAYNFTAATTPPATIKLRAVDADVPAVTSAGFSESTALIRRGRMRVDNAFGSAALPLLLPVRAEYYKDATEKWVANADDACSKTVNVPTAANSGLVFGAPTAANQLAAGEIAAEIATATSGSASLPFAGGLSSIKLRSPTDTTLGPGTANFGTVDIDFLAVGLAWPAWLPPAAANGRARAEFGLYRDSQRFIFRREAR